MGGVGDGGVRHQDRGYQIGGVGDPFAQVVVGPDDAGFLERLRLGESRIGTGGSPDNAIEVRCEMPPARLQCMTEDAMLVEQMAPDAAPLLKWP